MKIAQIAPIWYSIPPKKYGGTELVVYNLTEGLVQRGHDVTLYATQDSQTSACLKSHVPAGIVESGGTFNDYIEPLKHVLDALKYQDEYDILHLHFTSLFDYVILSLVRNIPNALITIHWNFPRLKQLQARREIWETHLNSLPLITISNSQQVDYRLNFVGTVYNSIDFEKYSFYEQPSPGNLLWISRICREKGTFEALDVARILKRDITIIGAVNSTKEEVRRYYDDEVKPLLQDPRVSHLGELELSAKNKALGSAKIFLFPLQWEEPFGLVLIEAMACGTPVVAFARGSIPEIIQDGVTGFIINPSESDKRGEWIIKKTGIAGLCEAVERIYSMSAKTYTLMRRQCRNHVEAKFGIDHMVQGYERIYQKVMQGK